MRSECGISRECVCVCVLGKVKIDIYSDVCMALYWHGLHVQTPNISYYKYQKLYYPGGEAVVLAVIFDSMNNFCC